MALLLAAALAVTPSSFAQFGMVPSAPPAPAPLPDLGDTSASDLSLQSERRLGESIMRDVRRDPAYLEDAEVVEYLNSLGARLLAAAPGVRQDFEFFAVRDPAINAFALPGGYIGVHTALITSSDSESEVASVLAHEIAHVTQRHIARQIGLQKQMQVPMMAAMVAAILLGRSRPDLAQGAMVGAQGAAIQSTLGYSRDFEREADRIGFQTLTGAGFDVRAAAAFFEKLQRVTRIVDDGRTPSYLRTHPITTERIGEALDRAASVPYRQHADSLEYHLVRAKLRAEAIDPRDAVRLFVDALKDRRFANEPGARYGLAVAYLRNKEPRLAEAEVGRLLAAGVASPMLETLAARVRLALGDPAGALQVLKAAQTRYPQRRPILYALLDLLQEQGRFDEVQRALEEPLRLYRRDARLHEARARAYAGQGKRLLQHQSQAEVYVLRGSLPAAIEQLQFAQAAGDGNFYELSVVDARLRELRAEHVREMQDAKKDKF